MALTILQPSFAGGELAPALAGRSDLAKNHIGAATLRNFFVLATGGAANRAGTRFVGRAKDSTHPVRLIPFQFSTSQTYGLEFGHRYMRVVSNGGHVLEAAVAVTALSAASPCVVTAPGHNYANGDEVSASGLLDNGRYLVAAVTATTFRLTTLDNGPVTPTPYAGGGTVARVYTLVTPYAGADLALLKFTQSADILTLCHPNYGPMDLDRTGQTAWTLVPITFQPKIATPAAATATPKNGGSGTYYAYVVTAVTDQPSEESLASPQAACQNAALNQNTGVINTISWTAVSGADRYRVYKGPIGTTGPVPTGAIYGYIGSTTGTSFDDANIAADTTQTPPQGNNPFVNNNNPGCVAYYEQRRVFAGSNLAPQTLWMTQPGNFWNMDTSSPSLASDAITATVTAREISAIKHLVSVNALLALTPTGCFRIIGGTTDAALTPTTVRVQTQFGTGASDVAPLVVETDILYVQAKGSTIRALSYNVYADVFTGTDISLLSSHLFLGHRIVEWAYAEEPFRLVWAVRDDGVLLSLTYIKDQAVTAWTRHDTQGLFQSVISISEGNEDAVYVVVRRTLPGVNGGQPVAYIERLASRNFLTDGAPDISKAWFVDCGLSYGGAPVTTVSGLGHLEGASVSVLADGAVMGPYTVSGGAVTLERPASAITVGLPYVCDLRTLPVDINPQATLQGKRRKVDAVTLRLENSRGVCAGPDAGHLTAIKDPPPAAPGQVPPLINGEARLLTTTAWTTEGGTLIRQANPLPCTVLSVLPALSLGDSSGAG